MRGASQVPMRGKPNRFVPRNNDRCIRHGQVTLMAGDAPNSNFTSPLHGIRHTRDSNGPPRLPESNRFPSCPRSPPCLLILLGR